MLLLLAAFVEGIEGRTYDSRDKRVGDFAFAGGVSANTGLEMATPLEVSVALPGMSATGGMGLFAGYLAAKELKNLRWLYELKGGYAKLGTEFEAWIGRVLNISKSNIRVKDGARAIGENAGYAVVDYIYKGSVLEIKLSGGALKEQQAKELAKYAQRSGLGLTYIFMNKAAGAEEEALRRWVQEVAPGLEVHVNYLYP